MDLEGIIIHKTPFKERDLICNLLLRSGKKVAVYFYGGRGGGKRAKGSVLEVGFMMKITSAPRRKAVDTNIIIAKEYKHLWNSEHIRENYKAFYLSSFFMEYIGKIALETNHDEISKDDDSGLFRVLSNSLYFLDDAIKNNNFELYTHLFIFLSKLSIELGVVPDVESCLYCGEKLEDEDLCLFNSQDGGFSCMECTSKKDEFLSENKLLKEEYMGSRSLRKQLKKTYSIPYKEYRELTEISQGLAISQFNYLNLQFEFTRDQFKTWAMISI